MDKFRLSGCIKVIALDIIRLVIILAIIFIIGAYTAIISIDSFTPTQSANIQVLAKDQLAFKTD